MKSKTRSWPVSGLVDRCKVFVATIAASLLATVPGDRVANAQTTIEIEKITCTQFVTFAVADPNQIGIWLSGYFHGKRGDKILRLQDLRKNLDTLKSACYLTKNAELSVMEVSETTFPGK